MDQGKRKDQVEFALKAVLGGLVGIVAILVICLVTVVIVSLC